MTTGNYRDQASDTAGDAVEQVAVGKGGPRELGKAPACSGKRQGACPPRAFEPQLSDSAILQQSEAMANLADARFVLSLRIIAPPNFNLA